MCPSLVKSPVIVDVVQTDKSKPVSSLSMFMITTSSFDMLFFAEGNESQILLQSNITAEEDDAEKLETVKL